MLLDWVVWWRWGYCESLFTESSRYQGWTCAPNRKIHTHSTHTYVASHTYTHPVWTQLAAQITQRENRALPAPMDMHSILTNMRSTDGLILFLHRNRVQESLPVGYMCTGTWNPVIAQPLDLGQRTGLCSSLYVSVESLIARSNWGLL